jgi:2-hydroxy-6-oxonona-2,4-dienedioate hydrolase
MRSRSSRLLPVAGTVAAGATALAYATYRNAIKEATRRIETGRQFIDWVHGPIELADAGHGPAVLLLHGAGGGFDQGLDLARAFLGDGYRVIAPSRFGYLGTPLPADASAEAQAEAHLRVLDALELEKVAVIGVSAGAPSAMQLCLAHPERCSALVLIVPMAYAAEREAAGSPSFLFRTILNTLASSDFLFWAATRVARATLLKTILGTPVEIYRNATVGERRGVDQMLRSILPISRRFAGISNDGAIGSHLMPSALEGMRVPSLLVSAADDLYDTYESALHTAGQIPNATFLGFPSGGHLLLGHDEEVRARVTSFLKESLVRQEQPAMAG